MQLFFFTDLTVIHETNGKDEREIFFDEDGIIIITMQKEKKRKYACNSFAGNSFVQKRRTFLDVFPVPVPRHFPRSFAECSL